MPSLFEICQNFSLETRSPTKDLRITTLGPQKAQALQEAEAADLPRPNSRNGYSQKTVHSEPGEMELAIPRDCQGIFEPLLGAKHQRQ